VTNAGARFYQHVRRHLPLAPACILSLIMTRDRTYKPAAALRTPGKARKPATTHAGHNRLRIIGGRWRGIKIDFPDHAELRPSPDRVRETLFNWLQTIIVDARCLDLFAGSGALGIEALSRGAATAVFVERDAQACQAISATLQRLNATGGSVVNSDALSWLDVAPAAPFNIVFLDPPYAAGLLPQVCEKLISQRWLAPSAMIYLESPASEPLPALPGAWSLYRSRQAGQVSYHLARAPP
jgi:16S rRNA (guanine966-N2)-methyltransferase